MKKTYLLLTALLLTVSLAAQNPTSYFMEGSTFRSQLNPAFAPLRGYINLPAIGGVSVGTNGNIALNNILYPRNGKPVTLLDSSVSADEALRNLQADNLLGVDTRVNLFGIGKFTRNHKNFWSVDLDVRTSAETHLPKSLFEFLKLGRQGNISGIGASAESYLEAGFNYSLPLLNDRLYVGVRGKFLVGLARAQVDYQRFDVSLEQDRWAVDTRGTVTVTADGTTVSPHPETGTFEMNDLRFRPRKPAGYGFAVDLGATYDILPELQVSLAVNDLGFISWSKRATVSGVSTQQSEFTGVTVPDNGSDPTPDFDMEMLKFNQTESRSQSKMLRASLNAGIEYEVWEHRIGVGLLYTARFWSYRTAHNITASVNIHPLRWFTLTGSYSVLDNRAGAVGLGLNLCPGWINFFVATDLLLTRHTPQWVPVKQSTANATIGIGIPLGRRSHRIAAYIRENDRK